MNGVFIYKFPYVTLSVCEARKLLSCTLQSFITPTLIYTFYLLAFALSIHNKQLIAQSVAAYAAMTEKIYRSEDDQLVYE